MKEAISEWLRARPPFPGLLAGGVRYADESVFVWCNPAGFTPENLTYAFRCMADTFQVLKLNQFSNDYVRWIYEQALLYCVRRPDGNFLGVFVSRATEGVDQESLENLLGEFSRLAATR